MKMVTLFFLFCLLYGKSSSSAPLPLQITVKNFNNIVEKVLPKILRTQDGHFEIPKTQFEDCESYQLTCELNSIEGNLELSSPENTIKAEFAETNTLLYSLKMPKAWLNARLKIKGTFLRRNYNLTYKIKINGIQMSSRAPSKLPGYNGAGELLFLNGPNGIKLLPYKQANLKIMAIEITSNDPMGDFLLRSLNKVLNIKSKAKEWINQKIKEQLQSPKVLKLILYYWNKYLEKIKQLSAPLEKIGLKLNIEDPNFKSSDYIGYLTWGQEMTATYEEHPCARDLEGIEVEEIIRSSHTKNNLSENNQISIKIPTFHLQRLFYLINTYSMAPTGQKIAPLLCNSGQDKINHGPFKIPFDWTMRPVGKIMYTLDEKNNEISLNAKILASANSQKKWPYFSFFRKNIESQSDKRLAHGVIADVIFSYQIVLNKKNGLHLKLNTFRIKKINGKAIIGIINKKLGVHFNLDKIKDQIEKDIFLEFGQNFSIIPLFDREERINHLGTVQIKKAYLQDENLIVEISIN